MLERAGTPRVVIAAASSGAGKTTVASALIKSFTARGKLVQPFTAGYDRADSAFLSRVGHRQCSDLDPWIIGEKGVRSTFCHAVNEADFAVIEDATATLNRPELPPMGATWRPSSQGAFAVARILHSPVIIVLDLEAMGETVVAVAWGLKQLNPDVRVVGAILNKAHSAAAASVVEDSLWKQAKIPVLGTVPIHSRSGEAATDGTEAQPERHDAEVIEAVAANCDMVLIERLMMKAPEITTSVHEVPAHVDAEPVNIAVAFDEAFSCYHAENLQLLEDAGATITHFSPLYDHQLPKDTDAVYVGGSVSDTFIPRLAKNQAMHHALRSAQQHGIPMFLEAGGVLLGGRTITTEYGQHYKMAGILSEDLHFAPTRIDSDCRKISLAVDTLIGRAGTKLRGHEFGVAVPYPGSTTMQRAYFEYDTYDTPLGYGGWVTPTLTALPIQIHFAQKAAISEHFVKTVRELVGRRLLAQSFPVPTGLLERARI
jgi:cobyrinic acid a,c-diamide synthase